MHVYVWAHSPDGNIALLGERQDGEGLVEVLNRVRAERPDLTDAEMLHTISNGRETVHLYGRGVDFAEYVSRGGLRRGQRVTWAPEPANDLPRVEPVQLVDGPALQTLIPGVEPVSTTARALAELEARRRARRGNAPPAGGLFGDPKPAVQGALF